MQKKKGKKEVFPRVTIMVIIRKDLLLEENEYLVVKEDNIITRNHTTKIHIFLNAVFIYISVLLHVLDDLIVIVFY